MSRLNGVLLVAAVLAAGACSGPDQPVTAPDAGGPTPPAGLTPPDLSADRARHERLARWIAVGLADAAFRSQVYQAIATSPYREQKVHLQAFLDAEGGRARRELARLVGEDPARIAADLAGGSLEMYLPVPAHRARWTGGPDLLVATAELDTDAPVGFDLAGRARRLDRARPPATPVLMVSRAELDFAAGPAGLTCLESCDSGGGTVSTSTSGTGLFMTQSRIGSDFEGWFKGDPEYEVHVLGQSGTGTQLTSYQCAGEHAGGPYAFDQNTKDWTGSVMLFSQAQLDSYHQQHVGKNLVIFLVEDDDGACVIKIDSTRMTKLLTQVSQAYSGLTAGKDTTSSTLKKIFKFAPIIYTAFQAVISFLQTSDDPVGNAVNDPSAASAYLPGANWLVRGENNVVNGAIRVEMR